MRKILFIDNFDSFTYNLVDEFARRRTEVEIYRNSTPLEEIDRVVQEFRPDLIVVSPGPASPREAGNCIPIIQRYASSIPFFGVCLGFEAIVEAFGGTVGRAPVPVHGKSSYITHDGKTIFEGLASPLAVGRYHSLCATKMPTCLESSAQCDTIAMALRHRTFPHMEGVLFHPESILTTLGGKMIENILKRLALSSPPYHGNKQ